MDTTIIDTSLDFLTEEVFNGYFESIGYKPASYILCIRNITNDYNHGIYSHKFYVNPYKLVWYVSDDAYLYADYSSHDTFLYITIRDFKFYIMNKLI